MSDWRVCKRDGQWRVYERGAWFDSYDSLVDAHSSALRAALTAELYQPGALTRLRELQDAADWWAAYQKACEGASYT